MFLAVGRWALVPTWLLFLCSETVRRVEDLAAVASATVRAHVGVAFRRAPMSTHCATPATSTPPARATRDGIGGLDSGVCWRLHRPCAVNRSESGRTTRRRHRPPHEHDRFGSRGAALGQVQAVGAVVTRAELTAAARLILRAPAAGCLCARSSAARRWLPHRGRRVAASRAGWSRGLYRAGARRGRTAQPRRGGDGGATWRS